MNIEDLNKLARKYESAAFTYEPDAPRNVHIRFLFHGKLYTDGPFTAGVANALVIDLASYPEVSQVEQAVR